MANHRPPILGATHGAPGSQPPNLPPIPRPAPFPLIHHLSTMCPTHCCHLPPVLGGRPAPFPLPSYLLGCPFPRGNRFETFRISVWGRCKAEVPSPTSGGAHSLEVIVLRQFAFRVARLLLFRLPLLGLLPLGSCFLPFFPAGFFLAFCRCCCRRCLLLASCPSWLGLSFSLLFGYYCCCCYCYCCCCCCCKKNSKCYENHATVFFSPHARPRAPTPHENFSRCKFFHQPPP